MHQLLTLDHWLFLFIHHLPHSVLLDTIALTLSGVGTSWIIWVGFSVLIFVRVERKDHWFFLPLALAAGLSEFFGNLLFKNIFVRARPPGALLTDYSFPSGHATFAWALAVVLASKEPKLKYLYYFLACAISLSRIYLGVHYPSDIVAGTILGLSIGCFSLWVERRVIQYRHVKTKRQRATHPARGRRGSARYQKKPNHNHP